MKKITAYCFATFALILFMSTVGFAQPGPPGGGGNCNNPHIPCHPPGLAPIDGGVVFLLISGILLGVSSLRKK